MVFYVFLPIFGAKKLEFLRQSLNLYTLENSTGIVSDFFIKKLKTCFLLNNFKTTLTIKEALHGCT